jgi:N-acetylmuramoyl-L-alanine amidase
MYLKYVIIFLYTVSFFGKQTIYINSINHHEGSNGKVQIELGTIVAIFSENSIPTVLNKSQQENEATVSLLFPNVSYKDDKIDSLQKSFSGNGYTFLIKTITKPHKGLLCSISYQANDVAFLYESIKNSSGKSGYIFRFINKKALKKLEEKNKESSLMVLASNQSPRIMIDPGHGGTDFGACGHEIIEKDLALLVSKRVVQQLRSDGYDVLLTRSKDQDISLSHRTTMANRAEADIFISIHANAAQNPNAYGIETFFYDNTYHNSQLYISDLKTHILAYQKYTADKTKNAALLAHSVQKIVCDSMQSIHSFESINRGVKKGAFQVLMGPIAPAILIEIGFISNAQEAKELKKLSYQKRIAQSICAGILFYFKEKSLQAIA